MKLFITGTDTNIGKTIIASWLSLHTSYDYFKPIQTGCLEETDSHLVGTLSDSKIHKEAYCYKAPLSPHLAAKLENEIININHIKLPCDNNLIVEGAGGVMVPINKDCLMIDLIKQLVIPVILVASSRLGTINHTLLSLAALRAYNIEVLGVIMNGELNKHNLDAIEFYGKIKVLAEFPVLNYIDKNNLSKIDLSVPLKKIFGIL